MSMVLSRSLTRILVVVASALVLVAVARADIVKLKDGRKLEGEIIEESSLEVKLKMRFGTQSFPRSEIASIERKKTDAQELEERKNALREGDADGRFQLMRWAERQGLRREAKELLNEVLRLDPDHAGAREANGQKKVDGKWIDAAEADVLLAGREEDALRAKGYVLHEGQWRSPEEMQKIRLGFVLHDDVWVTPEEKELLDKGYVKYKNRWVTLDDRTMLARGYDRYQGEWKKKEEMLALRTDWSTAWEALTPHYLIRTNINEEYCDEIAAIMEKAFVEYLKVVGREPTDVDIRGKKKSAPQRMPVYIFASEEEYSDWCRNNRMENNVGLDGFYNARKNLLASWSGNNLEFSRRFVVGLGIWQYYFNSVGNGLPSWFSEGIAGYFTGSFWDGTDLRVGVADRAQIDFAEKLNDQGKLFTWNQLITDDLFEVIERGDFKRFAAQSYVLTYYLVKGADPATKAKFQEFLDRVKRHPFVMGNVDILAADMLRDLFGGRDGVEQLGRQALKWTLTIGEENLHAFPKRLGDEE